MNIDNIVEALWKEKERIVNAITALEGHEGGNGRRLRRLSAGGGWAGGGRYAADGRVGDSGGRRPRRRLSAAARRKISQAAKARWAKAKKAGKNRL